MGPELKCAEIHQGRLFVRADEPPGACGTQGTVEKELRACIPHQAVPLQACVAVAAARMASGSRLVFVEKRRLAAAVAAGCAAHAGIAIGFKFKLKTSEKEKEESGAKSPGRD